LLSRHKQGLQFDRNKRDEVLKRLKNMKTIVGNVLKLELKKKLKVMLMTKILESIVRVKIGWSKNTLKTALKKMGRPDKMTAFNVLITVTKSIRDFLLHLDKR
jgi:hypothetical protein